MAREIMVQKIAEVYSTTEYGMFKRLPGNRNVEELRIKKILQSIEKVGFVLNPIIINERNEIVDGQGRFEALKRKGLPIPFIRVPGIGTDECIAMNINMTNWKLMDYVKSYAEMGSSDYIRFGELVEQYHHFSINVITNSITGKIEGESKRIRDGEFKCDDESYRNAINILGYLTRFKDILKNVGGNLERYYFALAFCYTHPLVSNERMVQMVSAKVLELHPVTNIKQAFEELEKVYNFRSRDKVYLFTDYQKAMDAKYAWYNSRYGGRA